MRLNRKQKISRNLLICLLLAACVYALMGFPPYTVKGMCRQMERDLLLTDLEPVYVLRDRKSLWSSETFVVAREGETYLSFQYEQNFLQNWRYYQTIYPKLANGTLCTGRDGTLYLAGTFADAASATAEVTVEKTDLYYAEATDSYQKVTGEKRVFTYQGEKRGDGVFTFRYRSEAHKPAWAGLPEWQYDLENAAAEWYSFRLTGQEDGSRGVLHADLPVHVTLYDASGGLLDTLDLTVDTYEVMEW